MADEHQSGAPRPGADAVMAASVFLSLLLLYLLTLLPGLGGTEDTPKFQYIGAVLGTAHDPGYPLYTMLTFAWSRIPLGTLAYRINVFSAVWGAAACAFVFLAMRRLQVHGWIAAALALAMGLGRTFWQHSVFAEVYSLTAALTAAAILALLWWDESRRAGWLYAAVTAASLAFGAHLIFVGSLPALTWFVLATLRWRVPWRVVAASALIVTAGLAQYGYVWVRTVQQAPYLESRAHNLSDLVNVMRGRQFDSISFSDPLAVVATRRAPAVLKVVGAETGAAGVALAVTGMVLLLARRRRAGGLLVGACAGQLVLLSLLGDVSIGPIALPAVALVWVLAGCGADAVRRAIQAYAPAWFALGAVTAGAGAMALLMAIGHYPSNNLRNDTYYTDYMRLLFEQLPPSAVIVAEDYTLDNMVEYQKVVTGRTSVRTRVAPTEESVEPFRAGGVPVFAFGLGRGRLARWYEMKPVEVLGLTLDERIAGLDPGRIVIICGNADPWPTMRSIGLSDDRRPRGRAAIVAVKGAGVVARSADGLDGSLTITPGQLLGRSGVTAPIDMVGAVSAAGAEIRIGGEPAVSSRSGLVVVEVGNRVQDAYAVLPERGMRVPMPTGRNPLFEISAPIPPQSCTEVGSGRWTALNRLAGNVLLGYLDSRDRVEAALEMYIASSAPLPVSLGETLRGGTPEIAVEHFTRGGGADDTLAVRLRQDGAPAMAEFARAPAVTRVRIRAKDPGPVSAFHVLPHGVPGFAMVRAHVDPAADNRAAVCALPLEPLGISAAHPETTVYLGPGGDRCFGRGWGHIWPTAVGFERALSAPDAELLLPLASAAQLSVQIQLGSTGESGTAEAFVNGQSLGVMTFSSRSAKLSWPAPAAAWVEGLNRVTLHLTTRDLPRVRRIELALPEAGARK